MNYVNSTKTSQNASSDRLTISFLAAGILFVAGYTLTRIVLMQPALQGDDIAVSMPVPHEAALWNADINSF